MTNKDSNQYNFQGKKVDVLFDVDFSSIDERIPVSSAIFITDENIYNAHPDKFAGRKTIVLEPGEQYKNQASVDSIINQLIELHADRQTFIVGVGGGVVTDIAGYAASIYMRGVSFAFVPTSILAMVDASIGGKNGIDVGVYKNLVGVVNHPGFLLYDYSFLKTLPNEEWINGFAEIIKHACIRDREMFNFLRQKSITAFQSSKNDIAELIKRNVSIKYDVVINDEFEAGERKLLNFGHTIGHAIENTSQLPHGKAISIGMIAACKISEAINHFDENSTKEISELLQQYQLPVSFSFDKDETWRILLHDKKKAGDIMNFIVLDSIGHASVKSVPLNHLQTIYNSI